VKALTIREAKAVKKMAAAYVFSGTKAAPLTGRGAILNTCYVMMQGRFRCKVPESG
jgi:hypothetical protein